MFSTTKFHQYRYLNFIMKRNSILTIRSTSILIEVPITKKYIFESLLLLYTLFVYDMTDLKMSHPDLQTPKIIYNGFVIITQTFLAGNVMENMMLEDNYG